MKNPKAILCSFCLLFTLTVSAQNIATSADLPYSNKIEVSNKALESLFISPANVSIELAPGLHIQGTIENKTDHGSSTVSILIKLSGSHPGMLHVTRYKNPAGNIYYAGQLLKLHDAEGLMLVEKDQRYYFIETQQRFLVSE